MTTLRHLTYTPQPRRHIHSSRSQVRSRSRSIRCRSPIWSAKGKSSAFWTATSGTKFDGIDYDGLLGRNILENFNLVFDYPEGKLYMHSLVQ